MMIQQTLSILFVPLLSYSIDVVTACSPAEGTENGPALVLDYKTDINIVLRAIRNFPSSFV